MRLHARRGVLRLRVGPSAVHGEACYGHQVTWVGEASYRSFEELMDVIARLASEPPTRCRRLLVALEHPPVQVRTLTNLPPVKDRELTALVAHQPARFFRRNGHPLVADAKWIGRGPNRVARTAAVEEPLVAAIVAGSRAAGLLLDAITAADEPVTLALLPDSERIARIRAEGKRFGKLALVAAITWIIVLGLFAGRLVWERRAVERQLTALQAPLAAVLRARDELREAEATLQGVAEAEADRSEPLTMLGAITGALPDSAVVTSLTWSAGDSGLITGYARRTADLMARIERSRQIPSARLEGPVTQDAIAGRQWDRFTVSFGYERGPP